MHSQRPHQKAPVGGGRLGCDVGGAGGVEGEQGIGGEDGVVVGRAGFAVAQRECGRQRPGEDVLPLVRPGPVAVPAGGADHQRVAP